MEVGIQSTKTFQTTAEKLAVHVGSGSVSVLATPMLIAAIEHTAAESVKPYMEEGKTTVGISVNVSHIAATPEGMDFTVTTELTSVHANGKILTFTVSAFDGLEKISEGTHTRAIVNQARFEAKANAKQQ